MFKGYKVITFSADTFFETNRTKYNVILGMFHDQVLSQLKHLKNRYINITLGFFLNFSNMINE